MEESKLNPDKKSQKLLNDDECIQCLALFSNESQQFLKTVLMLPLTINYYAYTRQKNSQIFTNWYCQIGIV